MSGKKVMLVTECVYPYLNANSEIVYRIAKVLRDRFSCKITILGVDRYKKTGEHSDPYGFDTRFVQSLIDYEQMVLDTPNKWVRLLKKITNKDYARIVFRRKFQRRYAFSREYQDAIDRLVRTERFDCVICFFMPVDTLRSIPESKTSIPFIAYKLDPWSSCFMLKDRHRLEEKDEHRADLKAAAIITSELVRREYPPETPKEILDKIYVLNYPNIIDYELPKQAELESIQSKHGDAHCVFAGIVYRDIRNPGYAANVFDALSGSGIYLDIVGFENPYTGLLEEMPDSVIHHGKVSSDKAMELMQSADILVNIGNTVVNMMPSKILTYISLGKPIINFVKNPNCPTLPFMEKYPLALNITEADTPIEEAVMLVKDFVMENKGKRIPFEEIEKIYYDCTPEYVGRKVYEIICNVSDRTVH